MTDKLYKVYYYITQAANMVVYASSEDAAIGTVRERLAADHDSAHYYTVSSPSELTDRDVTWINTLDTHTSIKELRDFYRGRN